MPSPRPPAPSKEYAFFRAALLGPCLLWPFFWLRQAPLRKAPSPMVAAKLLSGSSSIADVNGRSRGTFPSSKKGICGDDLLHRRPSRLRCSLGEFSGRATSLAMAGIDGIAAQHIERPPIDGAPCHSHSKPARHHQYQHDDKYQSKAATAVIPGSVKRAASKSTETS